MKHFFTASIFCLCTIITHSITATDIDRLTSIAKVYSQHTSNTNHKEYANALEALRSSEFSQLIDGLLLINNPDNSLLTPKFLTKPDKQTLVYWYVIREVHYHNIKKPDNRTLLEIAKETIEKEVDSNVLLHNYYYRITRGVAKLFNTSNLSTYDIDLNNYNLNTDAEKAICFFNLMDALATRLVVLNTLQKHKKLIDFAKKLPTFNGAAYYNYTSFDFEDFQWLGYQKKESYKKRQLGKLYQILNAHFLALSARKKTEKMQRLYTASILNKPSYFPYAGKLKNILEQLHKASKK